jgi:mRNA-degrading endonuclease RelE of RelBE toxin-antitoxin system
MFAPDQAREFLEWYDGQSGEYGQPPRPPDQSLPDWYRDRDPEWGPNGVQPRHGFPLSEYNIERRADPEAARLDDRARDDQLISGADNIDQVAERWRDTIEDEGFEAIAWYVPFHFDTQRYGIYIDETGLQFLGTLLYEWSHDYTAPNPNAQNKTNRSGLTDTGSDEGQDGGYDGEPFASRAQAFECALEILLRHEWYHHQVEIFATQLEDVIDDMLYRDYHTDWYQQTYADTSCLEESLANAYVERSRACHNRAPSAAAFRGLLRRTTEGAPDAYREYERFTGQQFREGGKILAYLLQQPDLDPVRLSGQEKFQRSLGGQLPFETNIRRVVDNGRLPVYILQEPSPTPSLSYFKIVQLETNYDITLSETFEHAYESADGSIKKRVDNTIGKLERSIHLFGFKWQKCKGRYWYLRVNDQFRMIADRDDGKKRIELIDFNTNHDFPEEYGCYT